MPNYMTVLEIANSVSGLAAVWLMIVASNQAVHEEKQPYHLAASIIVRHLPVWNLRLWDAVRFTIGDRYGPGSSPAKKLTAHTPKPPPPRPQPPGRSI